MINKEYIAEVYSGGSTKLSWLYGVSKGLSTWSNPNIIAGNSSGAIVSLFRAINKFTIDESIINVTKKQVYKVFPKKGLRNIIRVLFNRSLGDQSNLIDLIKQNYTPYDHNKLLKSNKIVLIGVSNFNETNPRNTLEYHNVAKMQYDEVIDIVYKSTCLPFYTEGVDGYYDGGIIDHIPTQFISKNYDLKHVTSVYSRDKDATMSGFKGGKGIESLERFAEVASANTSLNDELITDNTLLLKEVCEAVKSDKRNIDKVKYIKEILSNKQSFLKKKQTKIFAPEKLTESLYEFNKEKFKNNLTTGYKYGLEAELK